MNSAMLSQPVFAFFSVIAGVNISSPWPTCCLYVVAVDSILLFQGINVEIHRVSNPS